MNRFGSFSRPRTWFMALVLAVFVAGCGGGGGGDGGGGTAGPAPTTAGGGVCSGAGCVSLGSAGTLGTAAGYAILAKTGVSTTGTTAVIGNVGVSPAARGSLTGWSLISEPTDTSFTSARVAAPGKLYAADNVGGTTSSDLTTAVGSMQTAYTDAAGKAPAGGGLLTACPGAGSFGGLTITAGVYTCTVTVLIPSSTIVTLNGSATDVWVFQISQGLTQSAATQVNLTGGALPKNVFWQVAGVVDIGTTALMQGVILAKTAINLQTCATVNGRLLAQSAVTLDAATVTAPQ